MADDMLKNGLPVTAITSIVIAGLDPAIHQSKKRLMKMDGYAGQARV